MPETVHLGAYEMTRMLLKSALLVVLACPAVARAADEPKPAVHAKPGATVADGAADPDMKKDPKGRLPPYYSKLVDDAAAAKIYAIEKDFAPKLKELHAQLDAAMAERDQQIRAVLTPEQQKKLDEVLAAAKAGKLKHPTGTKRTEPKTPVTAPTADAPAKPAIPPLTK